MKQKPPSTVRRLNVFKSFTPDFFDQKISEPNFV